jgi:DNA (cytosine-5)-methyltransferase 1
MFFEFFAGGGMVRAGLGPVWQCTFANDFEETKAKAYRANWGDKELLVRDINAVSIRDLKGHADLAWASFPCQDLSLAGNRIGIGDIDSNSQTRSGTVWPLLNLMAHLKRQNRLPKIIALENVCGALTANNGRDFAEITNELSKLGYRIGAIVVDAKWFLPQSRQRLFIVGVANNLTIPDSLYQSVPSDPWHPQPLITAFQVTSEAVKKNWVWWRLPAPPLMVFRFSDLIQDEPEGCHWHSEEQTTTLIAMMSPTNLEKINWAKAQKARTIGAVYKRTRTENGEKIQRAEVRFDDLAGCLRTPSGGSSRQTILIVESDKIRSRLLSPREAARLMGLPDCYKLPERYNDAYALAGDGVAVPVVRFLSVNLFEPVLDFQFEESHLRIAG